MKQAIKKIFTKIGYVLGIVFCLAASVSLVYGSYLMIDWALSDHPDYEYADYTDYTDSYGTNYVYETTGQATDKITELMDGETVFFQQLGFEQYTGAVQVSYELTAPSDSLPGLEIYFVTSELGYHQFINSYDATVSDYLSCQKKNVLSASGTCTIRNGGGIIVYNPATAQRSISMDLTIKYDPAFVESN